MLLFLLASRFNRYIVECKVLFHALSSYLCFDLIDTLWNVKFNQGGYLVSGLARFNRYIVECKANFQLFTDQASLRFNRYIVECKECIRTNGF